MNKTYYPSQLPANKADISTWPWQQTPTRAESAKDSSPFVFNGADTEDGGYDAAAEDCDDEEQFIANQLSCIAIIKDKLLNTSADADIYLIIRDFIETRTKQFIEGFQYFDAQEKPQIEAFSLLNELYSATNKTYLKRLLEWGMLREIHELPLNVNITGDKALSNPDAWEEYINAESAADLIAPEHPLIFQIPESEYGHDPKEVDIYKFVNEMLKIHPNLFDIDYHPPSPYTEILSSDYEVGGDTFELMQAELAIETSHLFGVSINDLSEQARSLLFDFGVGLDDTKYNRIEQVVAEISDDKRVQFAEAFLALEFGDHLGEAIIDLVEADKGGEVSHEIFNLIGDIRTNVQEWEKGAWFAQKDNVYSGYFIGIRRGIEMRVSQILSPAADIILGKSQDAVFYHRDGTESGRLTINSIDQVIQGLKLIEYQTRNYAKAELADVDDHLQVLDSDSGLRSFSKINDTVGMTIRPYETDSAEARVRWSLIISPDDQREIFGSHISHTANGKPKNVKVSMRLDLEKISDKVALDLGTYTPDSSKPDNDPNTLLAALITVGAQHSLRRVEGDIKGNDYHIRETFPKECSDPNFFAGFAERMIYDLTLWRNKRVGKALLKLV